MAINSVKLGFVFYSLFLYSIKSDLRIYALLTSCDPLRLFIFNNGLVRMSTEKYQKPNRKNAVNQYSIFL
jgi:hypothetical protein